jgi:ABC-type branched-subunit amino acid transport system substrate-binding protein
MPAENRRRLRRAGTMALVGIAVATTAGCGASSGGDGSSGGGGASAGILKVGMIDSLTGPTAIAGQADVCGAKIAADAINKDGVVPGKKIQLTVEDDQSTPSTGTQAATKLTGQGINLFVGGSISTTVLAELPIFKDSGALHMGGTTKAEEFFSAGARVARLNSDSAQDGKVISKLLNTAIKPKSIVFVATEGAFGEGAVKAIRSGLTSSTQVKGTTYIAADETNFGPILTQVAQKRPDAVVWLIYGNQQPVAFMREYKRSGLKAPSVAGAGILTSSLVRAAGGAADGVISADLYADFLDNPANGTLRSAFSKYSGAHGECKGKPIDKQVALSYAQLLVLAQAAAKAKSSDPAAIRSTLVAGVWPLPEGDVRFSQEGQAKASYTLIEGQGGKGVVQYKPGS